jgi:hypothetical protein
VVLYVIVVLVVDGDGDGDGDEVVFFQPRHEAQTPGAEMHSPNAPAQKCTKGDRA